MPSPAFTRLRDFISNAMQMSHVYQPVMLRTLIDKGGKASVSQVANALLAEDRAQLDYYREITKRMPGTVLRKRGIVDYDDGAYSIPGFHEMTEAEHHEIITLCHAKVDEFLERRADPWSHRRKSAGYVSGTLRYEVLKRAASRCELCGVSNEIRALEVDHIVPRNFGGSDDLSNLQALCYSCNAMKRDRDTTEARREIEAWFATWKGPISLEERDLVVTAGDNVAFSTSLTHMTGVKTDGVEVSLWFRSTNGFRKEDGKWKIVHAHSSVPFYMDGSSKACLDLKP